MNNVLNQDSGLRLTWMNEPAQWSYTGQGGIRITAPAEADFFCDPAGKHVCASAPFLHTPVSASFELTAQLTVEMQTQYDSGCLMLMGDDKNWCKLCFEYNGEVPTIVSVVTRDGVSDDCNSEEVLTPQPYLKIRKVDNCVSFFYSADGEHWKLIRYFGMRIEGAAQAGVVAQSPKGAGCAVHFMSLSLTEPEVESRF